MKDCRSVRPWIKFKLSGTLQQKDVKEKGYLTEAITNQMKDCRGRVRSNAKGNYLEEHSKELDSLSGTASSVD